MRIIDLMPNNVEQIKQVALILQESFRGQCPDYDLIEDAMNKVISSFDDHQISRVALADDGAVLGWIGGIRQYSGNVYVSN